MKEMIYTSGLKRELLHDDIYKGYHYYIMSYGTHPCCYIEIPKNDVLYNVCYDDIILEVHYGLTYSRDYLKTSDVITIADSWFIGWDYAHASDYSGYWKNDTELKKWTIEELNNECIKAIDLLINNKDLYKEYFEYKNKLEEISKLLEDEI